MHQQPTASLWCRFNREGDLLFSCAKVILDLDYPVKMYCLSALWSPSPTAQLSAHIYHMG